MSKQQSQHAQVAKIIRQELKKNGVAGKVRARTASMMTAVDVTLYDVMPATRKAVEEFCAKFQYGHFDGMIDCYEYSNARDDIPQVKYLHVRTEFSREMRQAAWDYARQYYGFTDAPADVDDANNVMVAGEWGATLVHRVLSGINGKFWRTRKPRVAA